MKKCILLLLIIFSVLGSAGCSKDNGEQTTTGYAEFAVSETETEDTETGEIEAETSEITIESKHISSQEETEEFDPARMLSEDSKDICGYYLKAGDPTYQLEVKPGGRLNRNQLTFTVNRSLKESVAREPKSFAWEREKSGFSETSSMLPMAAVLKMKSCRSILRRRGGMCLRTEILSRNLRI